MNTVGESKNTSRPELYFDNTDGLVLALTTSTEKGCPSAWGCGAWYEGQVFDAALDARGRLKDGTELRLACEAFLLAKVNEFSTKKFDKWDDEADRTARWAKAAALALLFDERPRRPLA